MKITLKRIASNLERLTMQFIGIRLDLEQSREVLKNIKRIEDVIDTISYSLHPDVE